MRGKTGAAVLAKHFGCGLTVCDVGVNADIYESAVLNRKIAYGTQNICTGPAMTREQTLQAILTGAEIARTVDADVIGVGEMGIGNTTSTAAIVSAFTGLAPELTVGRGTGINDERMKVKRQVVADGLAINKPELGNAMDILCKVGGYDHAGLAGMIIEGARRRVPTMVDGVNATAAASSIISPI